jgi:hypothetical protein
MNINELTIIVTESGLFVTHQEYQCHCEPVAGPDRSNLRSQIHHLVDGAHNTVWSDGHHEEPSTRVYLTIRGGKPKLVEDLGVLIEILNSDQEFWELTIEDNLL